MSESRIVVERILHDNTVEYRVRVCSALVVDHDTDERVPAEYIAAYVMNSLREYVQSTTLDEKAIDVIELFKGNGTYTCPTCGKAVKR